MICFLDADRVQQLVGDEGYENVVTGEKETEPSSHPGKTTSPVKGALRLNVGKI